MKNYRLYRQLSHGPNYHTWPHEMLLPMNQLYAEVGSNCFNDVSVQRMGMQSQCSAIGYLAYTSRLDDENAF